MTQVSPANRFQPTLEALEDRFLPAVTSVIQGGVLRVTGDQQANTVFMMLAGRTLTVMTESGTRTFNIGAFGRIFIDVKGGDDTVNLNSRGAEGLPLMKPAEIHGGPGNDMVVGTEANDSLFGEANDDRLFGGPGQDFLSGGDGADLMDGGENFDGYQDVFNPNVWAVNQRPGEQPHAVDPTDVTQGYEGNCQLLASLVTIARTQPAFLNNSITHGVGSNYSLRMWNATRFTWVTVRLTFNGKWDDHDPRPATPQPGQDREYWTILYWQAYRRLMATQPRLLWANSANALTAVSGFTTWSTWNTLENGQYRFETFSAQLQARVRTYMTNGWYGIAGTPPTFRPGQNPGGRLAPQHAYAIMGIDDAGVVTLRNPWNDATREWGAEFTMTWEEFTRAFYMLYLC